MNAETLQNAPQEIDAIEDLTEQYSEQTSENQINQEVEEQKEVLPESLVGKQLSDLTTRKVIILVLAMMFSDPLLNYSTYYEENTSYEFGLDLMREYYWEAQEASSGASDSEADEFSSMFKMYIKQHESISTPLINIKARHLTWVSTSTKIGELRASEKELIGLDKEEYFLAIFDLRFTTRMTAGLSIARTFFVCAVLASGSMYFSKDAHEIVLLPIEEMIRKVNSISRNPIEAAQDEATQAIEDEILGRQG